MKNPTALRLLSVLLALSLAASLSAAPGETEALAIDIREIGLQRVLLLLDETALEVERPLGQLLSGHDFRLFTAAEIVRERPTADSMINRGDSHRANLILYAAAEERLKNAIEDFLLYEGEATLQVYSGTTGELLVSRTTRADGVRSTDVTEARRSARERALTGAANDAVAHLVERAHRIMVYEVALVGVFSERALLAHKEYIARMDGVHHVRRLAFDRQANEALLEILGDPRSEAFWRAYLEQMPRTRISVQMHPHDRLRDKYPSWFRPGR